MEIYDNQYYGINKKYSMTFGLWPYESFGKKVILRGCVTLIMLLAFIPQLLRFIHFFWIDMDIVIAHGVIILYVFGVYLKFLSTFLSEKRLRIVYENVANNWKVIKDDCERKIMIEFSKRGRFLSRFYLVMLNTSATIFCLFPLTPPLLNIIKPLNKSREQMFVLDGEYFIDKSKHFVEIYFFESMFCVMTCNLVTAIDAMYVTNIEHCVGLFAIIKFRLKQSLEDISKDAVKNKKTEKGDVSSTHIIQTIELHKKVIAFIDILELSYSSSFLLLMGIKVLVISLCSVMVMIQLNKIIECIRYAFILSALIVHLFYVSLPGQKLITCSTNLQEDAFSSDWYNFSLNAQKLLGFMSLRCVKPCNLTAGGLYVMNFPNFAMIIKSSLSYVTLFFSLR